MQVIRIKRQDVASVRKVRRAKARKAEEHLKAEVKKDPILKKNRLTGETHSFGVLL